ncbi:MAG: lysophospholipase [Candidatus Limnocylindrales bacterium]
MTTTIDPEFGAPGSPALPTSTTDRVAARDGTELVVRRWPAEGEPWASVLLVHGLAEHSGRYEHVGRQLADAGLDVEAYDQRGFGASDGRRAFIERWSVNHDDLEDRLASVRAGVTSGCPVVLFGHSLGALIALGYVVTEPARPLPDALVLSAPAIDSTIPAWKQALARILGRIAPTGSLKNELDGAILSRDPTVGERYLADPLNHHRTTFRFGAEALAEQVRVRAALDRIRIPTLVYHGAADRLVPTASSAVFEGRPGVVRRTWPDLRHESHNEPEGPAVIAAAIDWIRSTVGRSGGA